MLWGRCLFVMNQDRIRFYKIEEESLNAKDKKIFKNPDGRKNVDFALFDSILDDRVFVLSEDGYLTLFSVDLKEEKIKVEIIFKKNIWTEELEIQQNMFQNISLCKIHCNLRYIVILQKLRNGEKLTKFHIYKIKLQKLEKVKVLEIRSRIRETACFNIFRFGDKSFIISWYSNISYQFDSLFFSEEAYEDSDQSENKLEIKKVNFKGKKFSQIDRLLVDGDCLVGMNRKSELLKFEYSLEIKKSLFNKFFLSA